jgi:ferrous iron transport protein B
MKNIVLAGNPNVGKSVFFNYFGGVYADVSNFPGTTVEVAKTHYKNHQILDTPGIYNLGKENDEEKVAFDIIKKGDAILNIVDATHLERDIFLTLQLIELGKPLIVALNFMDDAKENGVDIDTKKLTKLLGVDIIETVATKNKGLDKINFKNFKKGHLVKLTKIDSCKSACNGCDLDMFRRNKVDNIINSTVKYNSGPKKVGEVFARLSTHPFAGVIILLLIMYLLYLFVGVFVAQTVVGVTEETIMQGYYEPFIINTLSNLIPQGSAIGTIVYGEFGLITMTITYLLGLLLPLVLGFYLVLSILEDSGYLPRLAALVDRLLNFIGLNGKAVIPLILGLGCVTCATITTRILKTKREKTIATSILQFVIPCSAQIGVIAALLAIAGKKYLIGYVLIIFIILVLLGTILNKFLPGKSSQLLLHLPRMRLPRINNVLKKTYTKTKCFMKEATVWFFIGAFIVGFMQVTGLLIRIQEWIKPFVVGFLQLPKEAAVAFIMGLVRRDFGAAGFYNMSLSPPQILVAMVTITLFVPCIASAMILFKERGWKTGSFIWLGTWIFAFLIGGIVSHLII